MSTLTDLQIGALTQFRHKLHAQPEISGEERWTSAEIARALQEAGADALWTGLGGYGVAAAFHGAQAGPTIMLRCELDALPIAEISSLPYRSAVAGKGHLCGHDGHMAILLGVAQLLAKRPRRGRVILLFQPAEETGQGAAAIIADPRWAELRPDYAFAYHNLPGRPLGEIGLKSGAACCASQGLRVNLRGKSSHAAAPEDGLSPAPCLAQLMTELSQLGPGGRRDESFKLSTLTHARLGAPSFGIAPGEGELRITLRSTTDEGIAQMMTQAEAAIARAQGDLEVATSIHEAFAATVNAPEAVDIARAAGASCGLPLRDAPLPQSWSEDFGLFAQNGATAALLFLGAGESHAQLHNPDYDFPDALIAPGAQHLRAIVAALLDQ